MAQVASPQGKEEKNKEDRGLFLQVPYHIIDHLDMSDNAKIGFIRFCRLFNKKDKTIEFRGYYRGLASALRKSPAHTISIVDQWVQFDLVQREETIDGVILKVNTATIWERNKIDRKTQQCLNYEQQSLYNGENESSAVQDINGTIQNINTAVYKINAAIQNMNSNEREKAHTRLLDLTRLLDSFSAPSEGSYSQETPQPTEEKKEEAEPIVSYMAEWLADLDTRMDALDQQYLKDCSHRSWLQETSIQDEQASQAPSELFPEPPKPNKHNIPDLRAGLNDRSNLPLTKAEQKRIDEQAAREKKRQEEKRTVEIFELFDHLFGSPVDRYGYNKSHVQGLARNPLATDEIITTAFNAVANSQAVKNNPSKLTITEVSNVVPSYIRTEQIKVVASQNKRKSIDEQIEESRRAAEEWEAQERARKERMVATHG